MPTSTPLPDRVDVAVVGAGLSGLSCARHLAAAGIDVHVFEAGDAVGGRVRTDEVEGFRLDRGFQVLLTSYDEVWRLVDREVLALGRFDAGSRVWTGSALESLPDPFRAPRRLGAALASPVGSLGDKMRVARLRAGLLATGDAGEPEGRPARSTLEELRSRGFGDDFIDRFFRPFLGGVFLDRSLSAPASLFLYLFRCFASGDATLPAGGMQRLPEAIAEPLGDSISLGVAVARVEADRVLTADGRSVSADAVVVATDGADAATLAGTPAPEFARALTAWFAVPEAPVEEPVLVLDGTGTGPVNHLAVVSRVVGGLTPDDRELVAASAAAADAGPAGTFADRARSQLARWFGPGVAEWRHLHTHDIPRALPQRDPEEPMEPRPLRTPDGVYLAGDDRTFAAIQGALRSGRRVAEAILSARDAGTAR